MNKSRLSLYVIGALSIGGIIFWSLRDQMIAAAAARKPRETEKSSFTAQRPDSSEAPADSSLSREQWINITKEELLARLRRPNARSGEATIHFKNNNAYRDFLARAERAGIPVLGRIDGLYSLRVGTESIDGLANDILDHGGDYGEVAANYTLGAPTPTPAAQERAARSSVPLGNNLLSFLGVTGDTSTWGRGVTIAIIDSGIQADTTFGSGRIQYADVGLGIGVSPGAEGGHGTAVAALAAGASPDAQGVAPAASLLSIRVADNQGTSDIFSVSQAIVTAVDRGARVINVSLGGYGTTETLLSAINYADTHGAVIVASAGNDQAAQLAWPAADPRVVSVGAVDALEQQVIFSNSGPQLQISAPGYGVQTAWTDNGRVLMDGTSASAPIVSGAIAAMMSANPGMSAPDAWRTIQQYTNDGGPPGADPDYGRGVINLGWAMARNDSSRVDTAISSHYYDAGSGTMQIVIQNRGGQAVAGLNLEVSSNGTPAVRYPIAWLTPGAEQTVQIPVSQSQLAAVGRIQFATQLVNPADVVDQFPTNNRRNSALTSQTPTPPSPSAGQH